MARPKKEVNETQLEIMAYNHVPDQVIAKVLGISEDTLHRRYAEKVAHCKGKSVAKLANVLWDEALNKRKDYAIKLLATRFLNMADKVEQTTTIKVEEVNNMSIEQLKERAKLLLVSNNE